MQARKAQHPDAVEMLVVRSTGSEYLVQPVGQSNAEITAATLRGKFRLKGFKLTNPIAVGDKVLVTPEDHRIVELLPRDNYLLRSSTHRDNYSQILCSISTRPSWCSASNIRLRRWAFSIIFW